MATDNKGTESDTPNKTEQIIPELIKYVNDGDINGIHSNILNGKAKIDECDDNGMTALHHAAYKGQLKICNLLIEYGANVNVASHDHGYSTLHFAALSGNEEVVKLLLTSGAKTHHTNSLNRTAAQMAGFVGNRVIVALINNFVPSFDIDYYTRPQGLETEPKLPPPAAKPLHNLVMLTNLHPVHIAMNVEKHTALMGNLAKTAKVLELMCEKESKRNENINEVLCLKFHFLSFVLRTLDKELMKQSDHSEKEKNEKGFVFEKIIKKWLIGRASDGFEECLEYYVQDAIKSFPYVEMPLFVQIARNVASKCGESWALDILHSVIYGQSRFDAELSCSTCGTENKNAKKCSKCKAVHYCDTTCQKLHWNNHKKFCSSLLKETNAK